MKIPSARSAALGTLASAAILLGTLAWNALDPNEGRTETLILAAPIVLLPAIAFLRGRIGGRLGSVLGALGLVGAGGFLPLVLWNVATEAWPSLPRIPGEVLLAALALVAIWAILGHLVGARRRVLPGIVAVPGMVAGSCWLVLIASAVVSMHWPGATRPLMPLWAANIMIWVVAHPLWTLGLTVWLLLGGKPPASPANPRVPVPEPAAEARVRPGGIVTEGV